MPDKRAKAAWRPIHTMPEWHGAAWVGDSATGTMVIACRDRGDWEILWSDGRTLSWEPDVWLPLPEGPKPYPVSCPGGTG